MLAPPPGLRSSLAAENGDAAQGRKLATTHCSRCHMIPDHNPMGGIDSTPSFRALTWVPDYPTRVRTFFQRHPHPVFVRVAGYPRWSDSPASVPEFEITSEQIEDILAFVRGFESEE